MPDAVIRKVREEFGEFGNMSPHPIVTIYDINYVHMSGEPVVTAETTWPTAEHLFQAMRFLDHTIQGVIRREKSPMGAKMAAKRLAAEMCLEPRSPKDVDNMRRVLQWKAEQHPAILEKLLATGNDFIVEDCSNRRNDSGLFWGAALVGGGGEATWVGVNTLGKLWMELRATRRQEIPK